MRQIFRRVLTLIVAALLLGAAIEQSYRIYLFRWAAFSYARMNSLHNLGVSGLIRASDTPELLFELKPGVDSYLKLARFRTNSAGLADKESTTEKPPNTRRIALVGSSFSMPAGVMLEDAWHTLVEKRLDAAEPGKRHEIINFAVGGYTARQEVAVLKTRAFSYQPELVLFDLTANSPKFTYVDEAYTKPYRVRPVEPRKSFWQIFALDRSWRADRALWNAEPFEEGNLARLDRELGHASEAAASHEVPLCFVILNFNPSAGKNAGVIEQMASRHSPCVIQTTGAFAGRTLRELGIYPSDQHPNPRAHAIFADVIAPRLAVELGLTPR